jgi:hypothetical protein
VELRQKKGVVRYREKVAEGVEIEWPMPVAAFLAGNFLERGDIVLTRRKGDFVSKIIRWFTNSPFSHSAMIFIVPHREPDYRTTFVIEAGTSGVDLTSLAEYANDLNSAAAIRRLSRPWFGTELQARTRGLMLDSIKAGYNYDTVFRIIRKLWFRFRRTFASQEKLLASYKKRGYKAPNENICSGFLQLGFAEAVCEAIKRGKAPPAALQEVIFNPEANQFLPEDWSQFTEAEIADILDTYLDAMDTELEGTLPQDLAIAPALEWKYVIRDGLVYPCRTYDEMTQLIYWRARMTPPPDAGPVKPATT